MLKSPFFLKLESSFHPSLRRVQRSFHPTPFGNFTTAIPYWFAASPPARASGMSASTKPDSCPVIRTLRFSIAPDSSFARDASSAGTISAFFTASSSFLPSSPFRGSSAFFLKKSSSPMLFSCFGISDKKIGQKRFRDPAPQTRRFLSDLIIEESEDLSNMHSGRLPVTPDFP